MDRRETFSREGLRSALRQRGVCRSLSRIVMDPDPGAPLIVVEPHELRLSRRTDNAPAWLVQTVADAVALPPGSAQHDRAIQQLREFAPGVQPLRWSEDLLRRPDRDPGKAPRAPFEYPRAPGEDRLPVLPELPDFIFSEEAPYVLSSLDHHDVVLLAGPTGCGKSTHIEHLARLRGRKLFRINLSAGSRTSDFLGCREVKVDRQSGLAVTAWTDGVLLQAMTYSDPETGSGAWLLVDEVDFATPEVLVALHQVLEPSRPRRVVVAEDGGRVVEATEDFRIALTANTTGAGDDTGIYSGTNLLNAAFRDRVTIFRFTYTPHERRLLRQRLVGPDPDLLASWAQEVRAQVEAGQLTTPLSTRVLLRLADKIPEWGLAKALEIEVLNRLPDDERAVVAELCHAVLGVEP